MLGEAETRSFEWEEGNVSLIFAVLFHIEADRRGGQAGLDSPGVFSNSP